MAQSPDKPQWDPPPADRPVDRPGVPAPADHPVTPEDTTEWNKPLGPPGSPVDEPPGKQGYQGVANPDAVPEPPVYPPGANPPGTNPPEPPPQDPALVPVPGSVPMFGSDPDPLAHEKNVADAQQQHTPPGHDPDHVPPGHDPNHKPPGHDPNHTPPGHAKPEPKADKKS